MKEQMGGQSFGDREEALSGSSSESQTWPFNAGDTKPPYNFLFVRGHSPAAIFLGHSESTE